MQDLESVDAAVALDYHNQAFCNPAEFKVVVTGACRVGVPEVG